MKALAIAETNLRRLVRERANVFFLFIFLTSLTDSVALIETRRLGVSRRMLSTPTPARTVLLGEALGRFAVALVQGLLIMLGSLLIFGVSWGDPLGAAFLLIAFCLVGSGAGMLLGSLLSSDQQAGAMGLLLGLGLAALGGSMVPLEVFPETMRRIAHVTPHAWGNDAFAELVRRDGEDLRAEELRRRMPEPLVRGEFAAEGTLESIAARFAVSVEAMAWRLCNLGLAEVRPVQH